MGILLQVPSGWRTSPVLVIVLTQSGKNFDWPAIEKTEEQYLSTVSHDEIQAGSTFMAKRKKINLLVMEIN